MASIVLAVCGHCCLAAQRQEVQPVQFDSYDGSFVRVFSSTIEIATADGNKTFRIIKNAKDSPFPDGGEITSISVRGVERVSFLKKSMVIEFEAEQDNNKISRVPIEAIIVLPSKNKPPTSRELLSEIDATTGNSLYRFTALIEGFNSEKKELAVTVRSRSKSERYLFMVDPEKTQVSYDLPDLKLAQPGDNVSVRVFPFSVGEMIATEVRVQRPSSFPTKEDNISRDEENADGPDTPSRKRKPFKSMLDGDEPAGANDAGEDPAMSEDAVEGNSDDGDQADDPNPEVINFDFEVEVREPAKGENAAQGNAMPNETDEPDRLADVPRRKSVVPRRWFKIN